MRAQDHITALFVGGLYYWFAGEEATADMCWRTGVDILDMNVSVIGAA